MVGDGLAETRIANNTSEIVSKTKIGELSGSLDKAKPKIRELLGQAEDEPDRFFLGLYGSAVKGTAREDSDTDAFLFYKRNDTTPVNPHLSYDLSQCFDSPAQSTFGFPEGRKPPNPDGKEDVEAHDITRLVDQIANSEPLQGGHFKSTIREIAVIFSPEAIGDSALIESVRKEISGAMQQRTGRAFDLGRFQELWDLAYSESRKFPRDHVQMYESDQADGSTTWKLVEQEYLKLFEKPLTVEQKPTAES